MFLRRRGLVLEVAGQLWGRRRGVGQAPGVADSSPPAADKGTAAGPLAPPHQALPPLPQGTQTSPCCFYLFVFVLLFLIMLFLYLFSSPCVQSLEEVVKGCKRAGAQACGAGEGGPGRCRSGACDGSHALGLHLAAVRPFAAGARKILHNKEKNGNLWPEVVACVANIGL